MRLTHLGLPVSDEAADEPDYVGFKTHDPDGHRVEVYWEPARPGA